MRRKDSSKCVFHDVVPGVSDGPVIFTGLFFGRKRVRSGGRFLVQDRGVKGVYFRIRSISETKFLYFCCLSLRNN